MTIQRETTETHDGVTTTTTEQVRVTYSQDWTNYNAAQRAEGDLFAPMLADLCSTIENAPQGNGRPRLPTSDMAFTAISRVYSGLSARRYDSEVREACAKGLTDEDPHFNSVLRYLRSPDMTPVLRNLVELSALPLKAVETDYAIDSAGFTTGKFERWFDHKWGKERSRHQWLKLHAMVGVQTNVVTSVELSGAFSHDSNYFRPLVESTAKRFTIGEVSADKAYSNKAIHQLVVDHGGTPYIAFKETPCVKGELPEPKATTSVFHRMQYLFAYQRDAFLAHYHKRSNVECTFSMIKRKFGDSLRSKSEVGQMNEILCKVIAHNVCVLIASM
jgi:transposase